jgi:hypothetical protein
MPVTLSRPRSEVKSGFLTQNEPEIGLSVEILEFVPLPDSPEQVQLVDQENYGRTPSKAIVS